MRPEVKERVIIVEVHFLELESDWKHNYDEWMLSMKCTKCAARLFPTSPNCQKEWADWAGRRCQEQNVSPEYLLSKRSPNWEASLYHRNPSFYRH